MLAGLISLFTDFTYEGARSVTGPFLLQLGAGAAVVGWTAGLGEFVGYALRLPFGRVADRTGRYWFLAGLGYVLNLVAVPLLALAGNWPVASGLILLERFGKAIRTPARDAMLSFAVQQTGRGYGFGLHEALDQVGAVVGPLVVAFVLAQGGGVRRAFAWLAIPAALTLALLVVTRWRYPAPQEFEGPPGCEGRPGDQASAPAAGRPRAGTADPPAGLGPLLPFFGFIVLSVAGFAHFQLLAYHFEHRGVLDEPAIPMAFALAMAVDAVSALALDRLYDRHGLRTLMALPLFTAEGALALGPSARVVWIGILAWGAALGLQESILRAALADLTPPGGRATAFGVFSLLFGGAWLAGSVVMGWLYEHGTGYVVGFSLLTQVLAGLVLYVVFKTRATEPARRRP